MKNGKWSVLLPGILFATLTACASNPNNLQSSYGKPQPSEMVPCRSHCDTVNIDWSKVLTNSPLGENDIKTYMAKEAWACRKDCRNIHVSLWVVRDVKKGKFEGKSVLERSIVTNVNFITVNGVETPVQSLKTIAFMASAQTSHVGIAGDTVETVFPGTTNVGVRALLTPVIDDTTGNIVVFYHLAYSKIDKMLTKTSHQMTLQHPVISLPIKISGVVSLPNSEFQTKIYSDTSGYSVILSAHLDTWTLPSKTGKKTIKIKRG